MSRLTNERRAELIDQWYSFEPINEEEEKIMCNFFKFFDDWITDKHRTVLKTAWLARMRPGNNYKELFNEGTRSIKDICIETMKDLKRHRLIRLLAYPATIMFQSSSQT